jgi:hypothetical protein
LKGSCSIGAGAMVPSCGVLARWTVIERWQKNVRMASTFNTDVWVDSFATKKLLCPETQGDIQRFWRWIRI